MAIDLSSFPNVPYIGTPYSYPVQLGRASGRCVPININWLIYGALTLPNVSTTVPLFGGNVQLLDQVRSVYIDNFDSTVPIFLTCVDTGFTVTAAPDSAGWYPLVTNGYIFTVAAIGFNPAVIPTTKLFFTNIYVPAYSDASIEQAVQFGLASPSTGVGTAGGGNLLTITPNLAAGNYVNGNLTIAGGGGSLGAAHGIMTAQTGQFASVVVDVAGSGYTGTPVITATGAQTKWPAYAQGAHVVQNNYRTYNGFMYRANKGTDSVTPTPIGNTDYDATGIPCNPTSVATFNATISPLSGSGNISNNFGPRALGDQTKNYINTVTAVGVFQNNLFGTPYGSGFLYLTNIYVNQLSSSTTFDSWQLEDSNGNALLNFRNAPSAASNLMGGTLFEIQGANIKIPATSTWRLNMTAWTANVTFTHGFAWTYSQQ